MTPHRKRALAVAAAALGAALVAGGAIAATSGHGNGSAGAIRGSFAAGIHVGGGPGLRMHGGGDDFAAAASYLGLTTAQLQTQLASGKTLAQIADATSGKSASGLVDALVAAEKQELAAAVSAGKLTQAQADQITATLQQRFADMVNGTFPPGGPHGGPGGMHGAGGDDFAAAASYLGLTAAELQTQLASGKTLAQVADATSGKSASGLVDALVTHEKQELADAVSAGKLTQAQADQITAMLQQRFTAMVNGTLPKLGPPPGGGAFGDHAFQGGARA